MVGLRGVQVLPPDRHGVRADVAADADPNLSCIFSVFFLSLFESEILKLTFYIITNFIRP